MGLQILAIIKYREAHKMKLLSRATKGFTLLEVLIVLVILAVLAGLAIPAYNGAVEKSRAQEALTALTAVRESMIRYHAVNSTYVGAIYPPGANALDYNPNTVVGGQALLFAYGVPTGLTATTFSVTATRIAKAGAPVPAGGGTVSVDQAGTVTKTGCYL